MTISTTSQGPTVNVQDFGAAGDGTTDDTEAFQNAVDALEELDIPGGTLCIPKGVYLISEVAEFYGVRFKSGNITIRGSGIGLSTILQAVNRAPVFFFEPCCDDTTDILIEHLGFRSGDDTADDVEEDPDTERGSLVAITGRADDFYNRVFVQNCLFDCPLRAGLFLNNISVAYLHANVFKAEAPAFHVVAAKPLAGSWNLFLRHNVWQDCSEVLAARLLDFEAGAGGGIVSVIDDTASSSGGVAGQVLFGTTIPEGNVTATYAQYWHEFNPGEFQLYVHASAIPSNTGWVPQ